MKAARKKKVLNLQGKTDQVHRRPSHRHLAGQKGMAGYIQYAEVQQEYAAKNSLSSKAIIQNRRTAKNFPRQKN